MAHKTLINGTAYEISGGRTLVNGTGYSIDKGKTLVGGTAYEVGFVVDPVITIIFELASYTMSGSTEYRCGEVQIDGTTYGKNYAISNGIDQCTLTVPIGTIITCVRRAMGTGYVGKIEVNGVTVSSGGYGTYDYTVTTNATIVLTATVKNVTNYADSVYITEIPEGHALVQITGSGSYSTVKPGVSYVTIDGVNYSTVTTVVVPIGTVVACTVGTMSNELSEGCVKVNGNTVLTAESGNRLTYDYTVNGNVTINLKTNRDADKDMNGYITITEQ